MGICITRGIKSNLELFFPTVTTHSWCTCQYTLPAMAEHNVVYCLELLYTCSYNLDHFSVLITRSQRHMSLLAWNQLKQCWGKTQKTPWMIRPWSHSSWNRWLPLEGECVFEGDGCTVMILVRESEFSHDDTLILVVLRLHSLSCWLLSLIS